MRFTKVSQPSIGNAHLARPGRTGITRYRLGVASRVLAATLGGYSLTSVTAALLAVILPLPRDEAVTAGALISFLVHPAAILWVFAASTAWRAWLGILIPGLAQGSIMAVLLLMRSAA